MDRRRLLGPLNTVIPNIGISSEINGSKSTPQTGISSSSSSNKNDIENFFLKTGIIENANGSAYLEVGNNVIEVSVFGPRPIRGSFIDRASFSVECKFLPYISQPGDELFNTNNQFNNSNSNTNANGRTGLTTIEHKISSYVETALLPSIILEKYPKSTFDVFVTIVATETPTYNSNEKLMRLTNWIVNCASVALVDANVEVKDIVTSGIVKSNKSGDIIIDPRGQIEDEQNEQDEQDDQNEENVLGVASFMNLNNDQLVGIWVEGGDIDQDLVTKVINGCNDMSKKIRANINSFLIDSLQ
ncbi:exosome exoribonuclease [Scheffersomyces amazonensis]|uniref:exosome exoribonuclease n=1 Tax=Scheffersomyces amazonensis TaxID=1078765 RepID=UPI00315D9ACC